MKAYEEWRYSFTILYLGNRWRSMVSFTPLTLYPRGRSPRYLFDRREGGPRVGVGKRKISCSYRKSNPNSAAVQPVATSCTDQASYITT
jgi:hypothetical protein